MTKKDKSTLIYSNNICSFPSGTIEQLSFENELSANKIEYYKQECFDSWATSVIEYKFFEEDVEKVQKIISDLSQNKIYVSENSTTRISTFIFKWFSRFFLISLLIVFVLLIIMLLKQL